MKEKKEKRNNNTAGCAAVPHIQLFKVVEFCVGVNHSFFRSFVRFFVFEATCAGNLPGRIQRC